MEYENTDREVQYRQACEKVKKIAEVIEMFRIKYYPDFSKISEKDKEKYDTLNGEMEKIVSENGLENLSKPLMAEISGKYNEQIPQINEQDMEDPKKKNQIFENIKLACCGAMEAEKQAWLSWAKAKETNDEQTAEVQQQLAETCQSRVKELIETIVEYEGGKALQEELAKFRRDKFAQLNVSKEKTQQNNSRFTELFKGYYTQAEEQTKKEATDIIKETQVEMSNPVKENEKEMALE